MLWREERRVIYELRHFDTPLMRFSATEDTSVPKIRLLWHDQTRQHLLPLDLTPSEEGLSRWLRHRTIPKNRAYVQNLLSKCGLSLNRPLDVIKVSKGLSLNDCYWVVEEGFAGTFEKYNLYDNRFSRVLALIAFTGYGSSVRASLASCPEFTTNGMLPKCWRRENGDIRLYKGGTKGASNSGNEPYSEFYAWQVAQELGVAAVPYTLKQWNKELCSVCSLFTSKQYAFLPVGRVVTTGGMEAVEEYYAKLGQPFLDALHGMYVLDALILNVDRHFGNFGFLVDNERNQIAAPAPLFDHGNSLFNFATGDDLRSDGTLDAYAATLLPCVYDDFMGKAAQSLTPALREGLRRVADLRLSRHSRYNLEPKRVKLIERQVQKRARELLKYDK